MKRIGPPKKWTRHRIYDVLFQSSVKALHVSYFLLTGLFIVQVVGYVKGKPIEILSTHKNPPHQVFGGSELIWKTLKVLYFMWFTLRVTLMSLVILKKS